jgi:tripartite-type tricarboxylate transporter receptor subunit TctC
MKKFLACLMVVALGYAPAHAQEAVSFKGKTVSMIIGFTAGGGADVLGRAVSLYLEKYLPGNPTVVAKNVPGAEGVTAMNFLVQQAQPDGLTVSTSANTSVDPLNYRKPGVQYVPTDFEIIGGAGRGGEVLLINKESEKRLYDKKETPVIMGSLSGIPRSGMQMTAWGIEVLGWNAKWVLGYPGTNELTLALERGEVDMTATGNLYLVKKLLDTGKFKILVQSGMLKDAMVVPRPDFGDAPLMAKLLEGKLNDPKAKVAFEYWTAIAQTDKWISLPPKTPKNIVAAYRGAFAKVSQDTEFLERVRKISEDFQPLDANAMEKLITTLATLPPEATEYMTVILRKQGLDVK